MLGSNAALFILWLVTLRASPSSLAALLLGFADHLCAVYVHGIIGSFKLIQTNCPDPTGTSLLSISTILAIGLSLVVFLVTGAKYVALAFSPDHAANVLCVQLLLPLGALPVSPLPLPVKRSR